MGSFAGGAIALNTGSAESVLRCVIGDVLDMDAQTAAFGLAALNPTAEIFQHRFAEDCSMLFGRIVEGMDIEITVWAVNTASPLQAVQPVNSHPGGQAAAIEGHRSIFDAALNKPVKANIVQHCDIQEGQTVKGPAAITEDETTIILPLSSTAAETAKREYALSDAEIEDVMALVSLGEDV